VSVSAFFPWSGGPQDGVDLKKGMLAGIPSAGYVWPTIRRHEGFSGVKLHRIFSQISDFV
jgi:hypothetical protein